MSHSTLPADLASLVDSLGGRADGDEYFRRPPGRRRVRADHPARGRRRSTCTARADRGPAALTIAIPSGERLAASRTRLRRRYNDLGRGDVATSLEARLGRVGATARGRAAGSRPTATDRCRARARPRAPRWSRSPTTSRSTSPGGGRLDHRHHRPPLPGRLQQRAVRGARPPAGRGGDLPAGAAVNTNTRYLHGTAVDWPSGSPRRARPVSTPCCSSTPGSEANDLAWRVATAFTARRGRCAPTSRTTASPRRSPRSRRRAGSAAGARELATWAPRTPTRPDRDSGRSPPRSNGSARAGFGPAALILDCVLPATASSTSTRRTSQRTPAPDPRGRRRCGSPTRCRPATAGPGCDVAFQRFGIDAGLRHARQADGQRAPGRGRDHPARDRGAVRRGPSSSARSAATRSPRRRPSRCSMSSRTSGSSPGSRPTGAGPTRRPP